MNGNAFFLSSQLHSLQIPCCSMCRSIFTMMQKNSLVLYIIVTNVGTHPAMG